MLQRWYQWSASRKRFDEFKLNHAARAQTRKIRRRWVKWREATVVSLNRNKAIRRLLWKKAR